MKYEYKVPLLVAAVSFLMGVAVIASIWPTTARGLRNAAVQQLESSAESRRSAIINTVAWMRQETLSAAQRHEIQDALKRFNNAFRRGTAMQKAEVRLAYTLQARFPIGARQAIDDADDGSFYSSVHREIHPNIRRWAQLKQIRDVLLVTATGDVVYSLRKDDDFGTNLLDPVHEGTAPAMAFIRTMALLPQGGTVFMDFTRHAASGGDTAAFVAAKLTSDDNQAVGAIILSLAPDQINRIMLDSAGLGETGETYLVGQDYVLRSDSRFRPSGLLNISIDNAVTRAVMAGQEGHEFLLNRSNIELLAVYKPIDLGDVTWGLVTQAQSRELFASLREAQQNAIMSATVAVILVSLLGFVFARTLTRPIRRLAQVMTDLSTGDLDIEVPYAGQKDEIGSMAQAIGLFKAAYEVNEGLVKSVAQKEQRLADLLNRTPLGVLVQTKDLRVRFVNDRALGIMGASREEATSSRLENVMTAVEPEVFRNYVREALETGLNSPKDVKFYKVSAGKIINLSIMAGRITFDDEDCLISFFEDVTDRRENERQLEKERRLSASLFEGAPDASVIINDAGKIVHFNRLAEALFGYGRAEVIGREIEMLMPERYRTGHVSIRTMFIGNPNSRTMGSGRSLSALRKDGSEFPIDVSLSPIAGENLVAASVRDITLRQKAEAELRTFEFTLENAADGIILIDRNGNLNYANTQFCRLLGRPREEVLQRNIQELFVESGDVGWFKRWKAFRASGGSETFEHTLRRGEEGDIPCEVTSRYMKFGEQEFVCFFVRDITDRKQAEQELRRVHHALEQASDGVVWLETTGRIMEVNIAAATMFGLPREQVIGTYAGEYIPFLNQDAFPEWWADIVRAGRRGLNVEQMVRQHDGSEFPAEFVSKHLSFGGIDLVCSFMRDITERKDAEKALLAAKEAAEEATRAKSSFLAMMSHEIRTPMNGVMSMAEMLDSTNLSDDQRDISRVIRSSAEALLTIINDILDFSKIEAGKFDIESIPMDLTEVVENSGELMAQRAQEKNLRLLIEVDPAMPVRLLGDPNRLRQVLLNLVGNAIKFTEKGHVSLRVRRLGSQSRSGVEHVRFEVSDTGIGLTDEQIGRLFQAFHQADASTSRKFGGTGLGLTICKRIVELMGGQIGATSIYGEGSTFWFELPFHVVDPAVDLPPADISDIGVVTIGFDETGHGVVSRYLAAAKLTRVESAGHHDFEEALTVMCAHSPKVVALLLLRDSFIAVEALERVKRLQLPNLETVVATPRGMISTMGRAKEDGAKAIVPLPLPRQTLWRAIAFAVGRVDSPGEQEIRSSAQATWAPPTVAEARAGNALILVAEDNKTNQHIIKRILTRMGYAHEMAENGEEALQLYEKGGFGMILTDYHMPVMDGFAMTTALREREERTGGRVPIVALTADAMATTEQHCLEAGMNGFLTKPINTDALRATIERYMPQGKPLRRMPPEDAPAVASAAVRVPGIASPPADAGDAQPVFNLERIADIFGGYTADAAEMVVGFAAELPQRIADIRVALDEPNAEAARDIAHALKGSARSLGAARLGDVAAALQQDLDQRDTAAAVARLPDLTLQAEVFAAAIGKLTPTD